MSKEEEESNIPASPCWTSGTPPERLERIEYALDEIRGAIVGNRRLGHRGLVQRMQDLEALTASHNLKLVTWAGIIIGMNAVLLFFKYKIFN